MLDAVYEHSIIPSELFYPLPPAAHSAQGRERGGKGRAGEGWSDVPLHIYGSLPPHFDFGRREVVYVIYENYSCRSEVIYSGPGNNT